MFEGNVPMAVRREGEEERERERERMRNMLILALPSSPASPFTHGFLLPNHTASMWVRCGAVELLLFDVPALTILTE